MTVYDSETRSQVQTTQKKAALRSLFELKDAKGAAAELFFGPSALAGKQEQSTQMIPGKGWSRTFASMDRSSLLSMGVRGPEIS